MSGLEAIRYERGHLQVLDQLRLPHEHHYDDVSTADAAFDAIRSMRVRGAPAIAIVAVLGIAVELHNRHDLRSAATDDLVSFINERLDHLLESRPTAVDLGNAISHLRKVVKNAGAGPEGTIQAYITASEEIFHKDKATNLSIGTHGAAWIRAHVPPGSNKLAVLTHCNTGSLATSGHGTALGIIRTLYAQDALSQAFCTETRPYNQGSRLTAFELVYDNIPATLITDSMAAALFATRKEVENIVAVIVGADRVVRNGDTANKIGTYALAVLARHHGIKFVVAAPTTTIDLDTADGSGIKIEERKAEEMTQVSGAVVDTDGRVDTGKTERVATADQRVKVWNPAFDVTPAGLIDAIATEKGVVERGEGGVFDFSGVMDGR